LRLGDVIAADELGRVFRTWTLGDAAGVLVVAPALMTWASSGLGGVRRRDLIEGIVVIVALVVLAELPPQRDVPYIVFPVLLWAALRFGPRGAATAILSSARSPSGTRRTTVDRSYVTRSRTACSRRSSSSRPRRSPRSCSPP
jgi:hypothetical protein